MPSLYSNGPAKDFVISPFEKFLASSQTVFVASPFVTKTKELKQAANEGKTVSLLVGLNSATNPAALQEVLGTANFAIRYYTHRFHAKIYLFDSCALVGSSNLTDGGMQSNREATVLLEDSFRVEEVQALAQELWSGAPVLTPEVLKRFSTAAGPYGTRFDPDRKIEEAVGRSEPPNIRVGSASKSGEYIFLQALKRRVYEQFKPAFDEVSRYLSEQRLRRLEWIHLDVDSETTQFLNWVRLTYGSGESWRNAPHRSEVDRSSEITSLGKFWATTSTPRIPSDYFENLQQLRSVFASTDNLAQATKEQMSAALMSVHAFEEQIRFVKGGYATLVDFFWQENQGDVDRVKRSLSHLVFGSGDFVERLYQLLNFSEWKIRYFGESCALELAGTVRPGMCPPMNGRSAKGLRYIGFRIPTN